ncbi:MAG: hypothetical protein QNL43_02265 [Crocinitomicaceae bacterium]|tara:strand:+ start:20708 stop:20953 length:246 start_codon:yes stop_codon:yes gene_type:complete
MNKHTLQDLKVYSTYLDLFSKLSLLNDDSNLAMPIKAINEKHQTQKREGLNSTKNSEFEFAQAVLDFEKKNFSSTSDLKEG